MPIITTYDEIPDAHWYMLCHDTFLSGWGRAEGKINALILPCDSHEQAMIVAANARARGDQKNIRIMNRFPILRSTYCYSLHTIDDYPHWYEEGYFKEDK